MQLAQAQGTPAQAVQQFVGQQGITVTQSAQTTINGLPASMAQFTAQTQDGAIQGIAAGVSYQNATYLMVGLSVATAASRNLPLLDASMRSFRALNDPALINVQPATVQLVTLPEAMTGLTFTQRYPSSVPAAQIYVINGMDAATSVPRGTVLKRVVGGLSQ